MNKGLLEWLLSSLGKRLVSVFALVHVYNNEKDFHTFQEISISFLSNDNGKLFCGGNGSSIEWSNSDMQENDLGEYGKNVIQDISKMNPWNTCLNEILKDVKMLYSSVEKSEIGILLEFSNDSHVSVINLGDDIYVFDSIPDNIMESQKITLLSLPI